MQQAQQASEWLDVYEIVTNHFISKLEKGDIPWHTSFKDAGIPRNLLSGVPYRGVNIWLLASLGYPQNLFLTCKQIRMLGASIKRSEKGHIAVDMTRGKKEPVLRYCELFNVEQCEHIPPERLVAIERHANASKRCKEMVDAMPNPPKIECKGYRMYYSPAVDCITMPLYKFFPDEETYYSALFYGLAESTGHQSRLNRSLCKEMKLFEPRRFNQEDLIAEMACSFLCSYAGIAPIQLGLFADDQALWLGKLYCDDRFMLKASMEAQRACDHILNVSSDNDTTQRTLELPELI